MGQLPSFTATTALSAAGSSPWQNSGITCSSVTSGRVSLNVILPIAVPGGGSGSKFKRQPVSCPATQSLLCASSGSASSSCTMLFSTHQRPAVTQAVKSNLSGKKSPVHWGPISGILPGQDLHLSLQQQRLCSGAAA